MVVRLVETRLDEDDRAGAVLAPRAADDLAEAGPKSSRTKVFGVSDAGGIAEEDDEEADPDERPAGLLLRATRDRDPADGGSGEVDRDRGAARGFAPRAAR